MMPCCDHRGHGVAGLADVVEAGHDAARQQRFGHQLDRDLGGHRQHPLAADDDAQQVEPGAVQRIAAEFHRLARRRKAAHFLHVVKREPVFQAMHAAGVFGHVAADGAGDLAGRVRRVVQPVRRRCLADREVAHPALHGGRARHRIELEDSVEARQRECHPQRIGHRAAGQARSGAARHHGDIQRMAGPQHGLDLGFVFGQCDDKGALAVSRQAVAFVRRRVLGVPEQGSGGQDRLQGPHHLGLAFGAFEDAGLGSRIHGMHFRPGRARRDELFAWRE